MTDHHHLEVTEKGGVTVVRFVDRKILDATNIEELGSELFGLIGQAKHRNLLMNFTGVEFLSSAALNKLIVLEKKMKTLGGKLKLCNLRPEIYEVFLITRLHQLFDIKTEESEALEAF